jgi:hypothetical protein
VAPFLLLPFKFVIIIKMEIEMTDENYPYDKIFDQPHPGLIRQELVTYTELDGRVHRTTVTRSFFGDDYTDSTTSCPIG